MRIHGGLAGVKGMKVEGGGGGRRGGEKEEEE